MILVCFKLETSNFKISLQGNKSFNLTRHLRNKHKDIIAEQAVSSKSSSQLGFTSTSSNSTASKSKMPQKRKVGEPKYEIYLLIITQRISTFQIFTMDW
jgi:hypothetical protein